MPFPTLPMRVCGGQIGKKFPERRRVRTGLVGECENACGGWKQRSQDLDVLLQHRLSVSVCVVDDDPGGGSMYARELVQGKKGVIDAAEFGANDEKNMYGSG